MDKLDQRILELIKDNARLSYSEIGKSVGMMRSRRRRGFAIRSISRRCRRNIRTW